MAPNYPGTQTPSSRSLLGPFRHETVCRWSLPDEEAEEAL
jgi:hypothetical protein